MHLLGLPGRAFRSRANPGLTLPILARVGTENSCFLEINAEHLVWKALIKDSSKAIYNSKGKLLIDLDDAELIMVLQEALMEESLSVEADAFIPIEGQ